MPLTLPVSYTTVELLLNTLPAIGSVSAITSAHIAHYIGEAQAHIDAKISRYYSLPLSVEVPIIQTIATNLTVYGLMVKRLLSAQQINDSPWPARYKEAQELLDDIGAGKLPLVNASGAILAGRSDVAEVYSTTMNNVPTFYEGDWKDMVQDSDKIDDEDDRRSNF